MIWSCRYCWCFRPTKFDPIVAKNGWKPHAQKARENCTEGYCVNTKEKKSPWEKCWNWISFTGLKDIWETFAKAKGHKEGDPTYDELSDPTYRGKKNRIKDLVKRPQDISEQTILVS